MTSEPIVIELTDDVPAVSGLYYWSLAAGHLQSIEAIVDKGAVFVRHDSGAIVRVIGGRWSRRIVVEGVRT